MKNFELTLEHILYALALVIAAGLRFLHLGALPLSDYEANWALQALQVSQGLKPAIGPNPAYVHLTACLFYLFGTANFLARFWPALMGSALVLAAWPLRSRMGRIPALVLAFGLAIDPGLVAMSHLAGGPMLAVVSLVLAALMWLDGHRTAAGFFAGLAVLSGQSLWLGLAGLGLAWAFSSITRKKVAAAPVEENATPTGASGAVRIHLDDWRETLFWAIGAILVLGSLVFLSPKGLPAILASLGAFFRGWWTLTDVQAWQLLLALPAYEILPLAFGIAALVRGILKRERDPIRLGIWALTALLLALIYPGKQTGDLVWAILPLWVLAAMELGRHFDFEAANRWEVAGTVTVVVAFLVFGWLNLASITNMDLAGQLARNRFWLLGAVLLLIALSLLLVGTGWSASVARLGGVWGSTIVLTLYTIAMSTGAAGLRQPLTYELWQPEPLTGRVDVIVKVANQISELNRGYAAQLPLTILSVDSPALRWSFRDWQVWEVNELAPEDTPEMLITPAGDLSLEAKYRGESLVLHESAAWSKATTADWLKWFVYRQPPLRTDNVILWVRSDLMLDSQDTPVTP